MAREISRRSFLRMSALTAAGAALAACTPATVEKPVEKIVKETVVVEKEKLVEKEKQVEKVVTATPPPKGPVKILFYERNYPQDIEYRKELVKRFEAQNPNIKIDLQVQPDDYSATLQARIAARTTGDMFRYATHYGLANYALRGLLWPIDEYVALDKYDLGPFFKGSLEACKIAGKLYALPVNGHPGWSGLYYQPEVFKEAGLPEPTDKWTYDDVLQAAIKLTKGPEAKRESYGIWLAPYYEAWLTAIDAFGGWPMSDDGKKAMMNDPKTVAGMQWIVDCMQKYKVAIPNPSWDSRVELWSSSKVGMVLSGIWEGSYLGGQTPKGKTMKVVPGPLGPSGHRGGFAGCNVFPIWRTSENPYEAFQWMKFLCSKEVGIEGVARIGEPGLRTDVWEDPKLKNDPLVAPHYEMLKTVKPMPVPANGRLSEIADPMQSIMEGMMLGKTTVKAGADQMQKKMQEILDQKVPGL
jgi:multiple sugar transport system substrate-binding protein